MQRCPILMIMMLATLAMASIAGAQDSDSLAEDIIGVWRMDPRKLYLPGIEFTQEEGTVSIVERMDDGKFRIMSRITTRAVAESEDLMFRPGCIGKTECVYDDASEGVGVLFRTTLYIDWIDEGWIDDLMKIEGDVMTGDDGNGLIRLVKDADD